LEAKIKRDEQVMKKKPTTWWRDGVLHVETPLGIVNIRPSLRDLEGKPVDSIEIIPDEGVTIDPPEVKGNIRLVKEANKNDCNVR